MEFIKPDTNVNFVGYRKIALVVSGALILASLAALVIKGPNWGIDFAGGAEMQIQFEKPLGIDGMAKLRTAIESLGLGDVKVQEVKDVGQTETSIYLIRMESLNVEEENQADPSGEAGAESDESVMKVEAQLTKTFGEGSYEILKTDFVGPRVGDELRNAGYFSIGFAMILILIYVSLRFELRFAIGAVLALIHDVIITTGAFVIMDKEFNLAIIAAILTIIGYSLNDTIVVFDRVRENVRRLRRLSFPDMINASVNETLSRTLLTSCTTLVVVFFLWLLGGGVIHDFAFALLVGVIVGTYSSIFVASSFIIAWDEFKAARRSPVALDKKTAD